jgi:hypothetical protein
MLNLSPQPPNSEDVKKLRAWLNQPEFKLLEAYLVAKDAEFTAEAGNKLIGASSIDGIAGVEENVKDAQEFAEKARTYRAVIDILRDVKNPKKSLETQKVEPTIVINT